MSIASRLLNIIKLKMSDKDISEAKSSSYLTQQQIEDLLADDSDNDLKNSIDNLQSKAYVNMPAEVRSAFHTLNISETSDMDVVTTAFRKQMQKFHPDKNTNATQDTQKQLQNKTSEIIKAYNLIKNYNF